jgi:hypothetical protein
MTGDAGLAHEAAHVGRPERCDLGSVGKPSKRHAAARREMKGVEAHRRLGSGGRTQRVWGRVQLMTRQFWWWTESSGLHRARRRCRMTRVVEAVFTNGSPRTYKGRGWYSDGSHGWWPMGSLSGRKMAAWG